MPDSAPPRPSADRNLLFGILALQMDFISRDALIKSMHAWVLEKHKPLGQILREQGALREDVHPLLEAMVNKHLELHGGDAQKSLEAVGSIGSVRQELQQVADADLHASLAHVSAARPAKDDPYPTRLPSVGTSTSSGSRFRVLRPHATSALALAHLCFIKKRYATATRFYADAVAAQPKLADDMHAQNRYNAACAAALAAAGQGEDAAKLDDKERARLPRQALDWLRADLVLWSKQAESSTPQNQTAVQQTLQHWQEDADLAGLRDGAALAKLPEAERADWKKLWADVEETLKKAGTAGKK
jgi:hypothetical protein